MDRELFRRTRGLVGSARWRLAAADADAGAPAMLRDFSCAIGVDLTPKTAPRLLAVAVKAGLEAGRRSAAAKRVFKRDRPFLVDRGEICEPVADLYEPATTRISYDYPSGHAAWGWTWALVLSAVAPDRAQALLERGRAFAESRRVCGVHSESAVEAGVLTASATMALVQAAPLYQADLAAARAEFLNLKTQGAPAPKGCAAEAEALAVPALDGTGSSASGAAP